MFFARNILKNLENHLENKQVTVLTGMRRTGKTTLVKHLMNESKVRQKIYFDLERIDYRELFSEKNYETIVFALQQRGINFSEKVLIAIDEIQLVPNLPSVVKYLYDTYDIKFILTGSSSYYLKNKFNESLSGRKKIFEIYPLSFNELLTFKGVDFAALDIFYECPFINSEYQRLKNYYEEYINFGGFPEVVLSDKTQDKKDLILDILSSYINIDLVSFKDIKKSTDCYNLIKLLAVRIGTKLDISKLTSVTSLTRQAVENYLDLFEQSYLIKTIPVISNSPDREIVKAKKLYFLDNGIAAACAELSSGSKFENAVFNQLNHFGEIGYYQLKSGKEIDFILNKNTAFEIKETATENDLKSLHNLSRNLNIEKYFVVGRNDTNVFTGFIWGGNIQ